MSGWASRECHVRWVVCGVAMGSPRARVVTGTSAAARCPRTWHRVYGKDTAFIRTLHRAAFLDTAWPTGATSLGSDFRRWPRRVLAPLHIHGAACIHNPRSRSLFLVLGSAFVFQFRVLFNVPTGVVEGYSPARAIGEPNCEREHERRTQNQEQGTTASKLFGDG